MNKGRDSILKSNIKKLSLNERKDILIHSLMSIVFDDRVEQVIELNDRTLAKKLDVVRDVCTTIVSLEEVEKIQAESLSNLAVIMDDTCADCMECDEGIKHSKRCKTVH